MHRVRSDEVYHFYLGDPIEMLQLPPGGAGRTILIGPDVAAGMQPQLVVPRGVWQGSRLVRGRIVMASRCWGPRSLPASTMPITSMASARRSSPNGRASRTRSRRGPPEGRSAAATVPA